MTYEEFNYLMGEILPCTPCFVCKCGLKTWLYEGTFEEAYKQRICIKCGKERALIAEHTGRTVHRTNEKDKDLYCEHSYNNETKP